MAKIKLPKNSLSMVLFWIKVRRSYRDLNSQADPAREFKIELEVIPITNKMDASR